MTFQISLMSITAQTLRPNVNDLFGRCRSKGNLCVVIFYVSPPQNPAINPDPSIYHRGQQTEMPAMYPVYVLPWPTFCLCLPIVKAIFQENWATFSKSDVGREGGPLEGEEPEPFWRRGEERDGLILVIVKTMSDMDEFRTKVISLPQRFCDHQLILCSLLRERAGGVTELKDQNFSAFYLDSELIENLKP